MKLRVSSAYFRRTGIVFMLLAILIEPIILIAPVAAVSNVAPDPNDDTAINGFRYAVSKTGDVEIYQTYIKAYFHHNNGHTITIIGANLCNDNQDLGASGQASVRHTAFTVWKADAQTNVNFNNSGNLIRQGGAAAVWGERDTSGACDNKTLTIPAGALTPTDIYTDRKFVAVIRADISGNQASWGTQNSFMYRASGAQTVLGMYEGRSQDGGFQQPGVNSNRYSNLNIPLRSDCYVGGWKSISVYDPDNGIAGIQERLFRVRVRKVGGGLLPRSAYDFNPALWSGNAQDGFAPGSLHKHNYFLNVRWEPNTQYRIEVQGVYGNNTLQFGIPWDSASYALDCRPNNVPTGSIVSRTCPAGQTNYQRIEVRINDQQGQTFGRIEIGNGADKWTSGTRSSANNGNNFYNIPGGDIGKDFQNTTYPIRLYARDRLTTGSLGGWRQVASSTTVRCQGSTTQVRPFARTSPSYVEVGGNVTGTTGYITSFTLPSNTYSNGVMTRQNRGPYISYTSRMWLDDGSRSYGSGDTMISTSNNGQYTISNRPNTPNGAAIKSNWARNGVTLSPSGNPQFRVCVGITITRAWYEYRTQGTAYQPRGPLIDHDNNPRTPRIRIPPRGYWYGTGFSGWRQVNIPRQTNEEVNCSTIQKFPSMEVQEGDIEVGGVFRRGLNACTANIDDLADHSVIGHSHAISPQLRGSRAQYGVLAAGTILNFGSNNQRPNRPGASDLAFARIGSNLGRFYGNATGSVTTSCFDDAFGSYPDTATPISSNGGTLSSTSNGESSFNFTGSNGTLNISGGTLGPGTRRIIRVTQNSGGDQGNKVVITGNITHGGGAGSIYQMPEFILLVDGEIDIQVNDSVRSLDGLYATRGSFLTCAQFNPEDPNIHVDSNSRCRETLTVNGAVIAGNSVLPYRTNAASTNYGDPAEIFRLRGDILISDYARKRQSGSFTTIGELELPPRF